MSRCLAIPRCEGGWRRGRMGRAGRRDDGAQGSRLPAMSDEDPWRPSSHLEHGGTGQKTELPAPPKAPRRRRLWLPTAGGVILVSAFIAIASVTSREAPDEGANRIPVPPPGDLRATAQPFSVRLVWQPSEHPEVDGYLVYRGGALLGATRGDTRFVDADALPGQSYLFRSLPAPRTMRDLNPRISTCSPNAPRPRLGG
jgi:hypothetical protein